MFIHCRLHFWQCLCSRKGRGMYSIDRDC